MTLTNDRRKTATKPAAAHDALLQAAQALKHKQLDRARTLLRAVMRPSADNTPPASASDQADAWFLASYLAPTSEARVAALEVALKFDPGHVLAQGALVRAQQADTTFADLRAAGWTPNVSALLTMDAALLPDKG